jgi:cation diffusion facilitator CzcD-associated flavoprotein CzcO
MPGERAPSVVIVGAEGRSLRDEWASGAHAHLGVCVPGFPSLFLMYGPNTNTSGGSIVFYEETQAAYIRRALSELRSRRAAAIVVRPKVEAASDREVQAAFAGTAWTQCDSWYRDERGADRRQLARLHDPVRRAFARVRPS